MSAARIALLLVAVSLVGLPPAGSSVQAQESGLEAEAALFMEGYAEALRTHDREAVADLYHRRGTYLLIEDTLEFLPWERVHAMYTEQWMGPTGFEWRDLAYEVVGPDAVVVMGRLRFGLPGDRGVLEGGYSALLLREDGALRIRKEHEAFEITGFAGFVESEARALMERYAEAYRDADAEAAAALYHPDGLHELGPDTVVSESWEEVRTRYEEGWRPPTSFTWSDMSYLVTGPDAVLVLGRLEFGLDPEPPLRASYSALLQRVDGRLRIRTEHMTLASARR